VAISLAWCTGFEYGAGTICWKQNNADRSQCDYGRWPSDGNGLCLLCPTRVPVTIKTSHCADATLPQEHLYRHPGRDQWKIANKPFDPATAPKTSGSTPR
jgi:hypothetical protein